MVVKPKKYMMLVVYLKISPVEKNENEMMVVV